MISTKKKQSMTKSKGILQVIVDVISALCLDARKGGKTFDQNYVGTAVHSGSSQWNEITGGVTIAVYAETSYK